MDLLKPSETNALNNDSENVCDPKVKRSCLKNLIVFSIAYLLQFSAANGLSNLQSSLNSKENLGVTSLLVSSVFFTLTCLFVPNIMLQFAGFKWPLIICNALVSCYICANFNANFIGLISASVLLGIALGTLWTYQGSFIAHLTHVYNRNSASKNPNLLVKFFGFFFILFQLNQLIGNFISSMVLNPQSIEKFASSFSAERNHSVNLTCGKNECPGPSSVIPRPDDQKVFILCSIYLGISLTAVFSLIFFLDNIKPDQDDLDKVSKTVKETFKLLFTSLEKLLILPILGFYALIVTFFCVEFSRFFIACAYGIHSIGLWFVIMGISSSIFSIIMGHVTKYIRKTNMLMIVVVLKCASIIYLLYWEKGSSVYFIILLAVIIGCLDTIYATCINAIIGDVFHDKLSSAYAANRFCMSLFFLLSYSLSEVFCVYEKMYRTISLICITIFKNRLDKVEE
ncbi:UNC93 [Brachionus plicatilis]|uniref:UNC93 n=1 Tax=Brachionus plicatilis TaxID=10195 RepID=A0A3M7SAY5_BRAPC|nr:UNC93 [Brachionus plicatilis]